MLIDMHAHTSEISTCCKINAEDGIVLAKEKGYDGVAIMNHYTATYFNVNTYDAWIDSYIAEWEHCRALGLKHGMRVFCGVEVTLDGDPRLHMLIYGADAEFLKSNPYLNTKSVEELYALCKANGCALVQAHPYRGGTTVQDVNFLDGIEINCHPLYHNSFYREMLDIATANGLSLTVGCDYHNDTYRPVAGSVLPDELASDKELANFILTSRRFEMQIHDPVDERVFTMVYEK